MDQADKMMEMLGSLPDNERNEILEEAGRQLEELQLQAERARTREGLIQRFKDSRAKFVRPGGILAAINSTKKIPSDGVALAFSNNTNCKPTFNMKSLASLKPLICHELVAGTTHRGRYICGWVAVDDAFYGIASTSLLLEDVMGEIVEIAIYGLVDSEMPPHEKQRFVASRFPKGKPVAIIEPYYKVRQDLSVGIRVDQQKELISWKAVPRNLATWKKLGNNFFSNLNVINQGLGALACYNRATQTIDIEVKKIAVLLNNIAACRFKVSDFNSAVQLAGVAVHLNPSYVKAWFRLASSLVKLGTASEDKETCCRTAQRVVAYACHTVPRLTINDRRLLESTIENEKVCSFDAQLPFQSYIEWCAEIEVPHLLMAIPMNANDFSPDADAWRETGTERFNKGAFRTAEECYRKGLNALVSYSCDVSLILNNAAAVYLMQYNEAKIVPNISVDETNTLVATEDKVPSSELALLNCTVAGILDPLNFKAWTRRARCLQTIGYPPEKCIAHLELIRTNVISRALSSPKSQERVEKFKIGMKSQMKEMSNRKAVFQVSELSTDAQRKQRDALKPHNFASSTRYEEFDSEKATLGDEKESIDQYITRMESFENMMRMGYAVSKSSSRKENKKLPREMMMFLKHPPPKIHLEFPNERGWPEGIDPVFAGKVLYRAYLDASASPWVSALSLRNGTFHSTIKACDVIKRWHGTAALQVLESKANSVRFGDIIDARDAQDEALPRYDARIRSNFANNPNRAEVYFFGTTHVAIGLNDLSSLLSATLQEQADTAGPLRFVGFEMSEFAVAKCKVVAHMLRSPSVALTSVLEVWLSSTWSSGTLKDFRNSVKMVIKSLDEQKENVKVLLYLKCWNSAEPISAAKARFEFFQNLERYNSKALHAAYCFRRKIDTLDLTEYMLTGEIKTSAIVLNVMSEESAVSNHQESKYGKSAAKNRKHRKKQKAKKAAKSLGEARLVGSMTMWNVPSGAPPLEEDIALNIVEFTRLVREYSHREKGMAIHELSVVDLFVLHVTQKLRFLRALLETSKLTIEVMYGVVKAVRGEGAKDPENLKLLLQIAKLRPYTISWSNVLDYFVLEDFHDLARRCSVYGNCVHYGYSMNWSTQVYGASLIDYNPKQCKEFIDTVLNVALGIPDSSNSIASSFNFHQAFKMDGLDKLVNYPFRENPLNSTGYALAHIYKQHWIDFFLEKGQLSAAAAHRLGSFCTSTNSGLKKGTMDLFMPAPLYRTSMTLYMSWCYDKSLRLEGVNDPSDIPSGA
ncbi:hypothetical protein CCR75_008477 [Bremia lactucae]|uniref:Uncharacterized protein n=1 Tax=Bremia lactucae TaxID=4779 RepID=A0A976IIZ2_BRELC|nr:hypothetical protein CCR75_008477 [Bremia lactucae]